jgi:hypothetical protein
VEKELARKKEKKTKTKNGKRIVGKDAVLKVLVNGMGNKKNTKARG